MSPPDALDRARAGHRRLKTWLVEAAAPLWASAGIDQYGAFHEMLGQDGAPVAASRRARVQPRQVYALLIAQRLGAWVDAEVSERAFALFLQRYRRPDGLIRALVDGAGAVLDDGVVLYDQAFALLALATLQPEIGVDAEAKALALRTAIRAGLGREQGFETGLASDQLLASNPHMHLLEACLAWMAAGGDAEWTVMAETIVTLALERFVDPRTGALREFFNADWRPAPGEAGRLVEPGHQFEWAWLLLRWSRLAPRRAQAVDAGVTAFRLLHVGEEHGVDPKRNVAINGLLDDLSIHDAEARLWPQTERIKVWALVGAQTGGGWDGVADAIEGLELYLATPMRGLWFDRMTADGTLVDAPAPASSFYHIVCAIEALDEALKAAPCV